MKKLLLAILISSVVTACGGGGDSSVEAPSGTSSTGSDSSAELPSIDESEAQVPEKPIALVNPNGFTEEEIRLDWGIPPAPDVSHPDYNTIKGVDDYGIAGARDDWEIANAIATYPDQREFSILNKAAVNNREMIEAYESGNDAKIRKLFEEYIWILACHGYYYYDSNSNTGLLRDPAKNTEQRKEYDKDISKWMDPFLDDYDSLPTRAENREKCPTFITQ